MSGPLEGIRVVELTNGQATAQVGQMLADYGAQVIMVEPPGGSPLRHEYSFAQWARGKNSLELDLKCESDIEGLHRLIASADVLVQSFRPGVAERLGLGFDALAARNPRLVFGSIDAWGTQSKYANAPGYEGLVQARLGHFNSLKVDREGPAFYTSSFASFGATLGCIQGILAALYEREFSGLGQRVDVSMAQALAGLDISFQPLFTQIRRASGAYPATPAYDEDFNPAGSFAARALLASTKDGYLLQFSALQPKAFNALVDELGLAWMREDPEWTGFPDLDSNEKNGELLDLMLIAVRQKSLAQWEEIFELNPDVGAEVFRSGTELLHHPQIEHDRSTVCVVDPIVGKTTQMGSNIQFDKTPCTVVAGAPLLDDFRKELDELGASRPAIVSGVRDSVNKLPLEGVTILEFGVFYAGPWSATWLTDLGARVIKIEGLKGDPARFLSPTPEAGGLKVLQGKESIALDLATPEGLAIVHELAKKADLVVCSFRAGVADRLGVGAKDLHAVNPDLMYLNAVGFGADGPYARYPAYAMTISAGTGLAVRNFGVPNPREYYESLPVEDLRRESMRLRSATTLGTTNPDGFAGMTGAIALLLGLIARQRGSKGQTMYCTMSVSTAHLLSDSMIEGPGVGAPLLVDPESYGLNALYRLYQSSDGWIFLAAPTKHEFEKLGIALARFVDVNQLEWFDETNRPHTGAEHSSLLAREFLQKPSQFWEDSLLAVDVGCVVVPKDGLLESEMFGDFGQQSGFVMQAYSPIFEVQDRLTPLVRMSRSETQALGGCTIGQHTVGILTELGHTQESIEDLRRRSLIAGER